MKILYSKCGTKIEKHPSLQWLCNLLLVMQDCTLLVIRTFLQLTCMYNVPQHKINYLSRDPMQEYIIWKYRFLIKYKKHPRRYVYWILLLYWFPKTLSIKWLWRDFGFCVSNFMCDGDFHVASDISVVGVPLHFFEWKWTWFIVSYISMLNLLVQGIM